MNQLTALVMFPCAFFAFRNIRYGYEEKEMHALPQVGDSFTCDGIPIEMGAMLAQGGWGAVFVTQNAQYAVKVEVKNMYSDKFWHLKDLKHECGILRQLTLVDGISVPRCLGICEHDGRQVMIMDLVKNAVDMRQVGSNVASYDMYSIGAQVYTSTAAMLSSSIVNVDQHPSNILVTDDSEVVFIDMGMAERESEIDEKLRDESYVKLYSAMNRFAALSFEDAYANQVGSQYSMTAHAALSSLPINSLDAMQGMVDAFCSDAASKYVVDKLYVIAANSLDKVFLEAFKGKSDAAGELVEPSLLRLNTDGRFVKIEEGPIQVQAASGKERRENHNIPKGAVLIAVKCDADADFMDLAKFNPARYKDDLCKGKYYFQAKGFQYVTHIVEELLVRAGPSAADLLLKAQTCQP
eukprot:TRINITY_DN71692_c0_g1_i1.p1 TRINITY_DN71692_c0_g1~~TRINITY_DN71692_c0_g1_i1.p1  ORF type:complete len:409 (-),score=62.12 TRINITY_DN71692_c0_g1_i1:73-1299(-)